MNEGELNSTKVYDVPLLPYWLGFATLNALEKIREALKKPVFVLNEGIANNMMPSEAFECVSALFPHIPMLSKTCGLTSVWMEK